MNVRLLYKPYPKTRPHVTKDHLIENVVKREEIGDYHRNGGNFIIYRLANGASEWWDFNAIEIISETNNWVEQ